MDVGTTGSPMETDGTKQVHDDQFIPRIDDEIDHLRIPDTAQFWNNGTAMYKLADRMENFIQQREPNTQPQINYMNMVKERGEKVVTAITTRYNVEWNVLKSMSLSERKKFFQSKPPTLAPPAQQSYASMVTKPPRAKIPGGNQYVRIHCSYLGRQEQRSIPAFASQVRAFLRSLLLMGKIIDRTMTIAAWDTQAADIGIKEIQGMSDDAVCAYIKMPKDKFMLKGRVNMIGVRLVTKVPGWRIARNFAVLRYSNKQTDSSIIVKEAPSHKGTQSFQIGYFQGTSPNGDYETFRAEIKEVTDGKAEISWQNLYIRGVSGKIWAMAKKEASKVGDTTSTEHKRKKFQLAPEGLQANVRSRDEIKPMKILLMKKYGKRVQVADGSIIRFIPFATNPSSMSAKMKSKLTKRLAWQSLAKAGEEKFPVSLRDIYEPKEYLQGKSVEQVIHEMESSNLRIFRHIGIRWNTNLNANDYELIAHSSMVGEAAKMVDQLKHHMFEFAQGDQRVWNHFLDGATNLSDSAAAAKQQVDDNDNEVNAFYESDEDSVDDEIENQLLSPGFIQILQAQQGQAIPFDESSTMYETQTSASKKSTGSDESMYTVKSILTTESNRTNNTGISGITWDEGVQHNQKKSTEETIDEHLQEKIKDWKTFVKWREEEKFLYEGVCASRSTATTKAASVLKLYSEVIRKRKLKNTLTSSNPPRTVATDEPGQNP